MPINIHSKSYFDYVHKICSDSDKLKLPLISKKLSVMTAFFVLIISIYLKILSAENPLKKLSDKSIIQQTTKII